MLIQLIERRRPFPPRALFLPLITKSAWTPLLELDYNLHKSNSTYFADLDVARAQLMLCLFRTGIERLIKGEETVMVEETRLSGSVARYGVENHAQEALKGGGKFLIALGGISCHFKKEIKAYSGYEIWTRVLSWDRKWIYLVSHIVKRGLAKPEEYVLQTGRWRGRSAEIRSDKDKEISEEARTKRKEEWKRGIYATSVAKYVVKRGRITIPPELVLERSRLLPPRPPERKEDPISKPTLEGDASADQSMISVEAAQAIQDEIERSAVLVNGVKTAGTSGANATPVNIISNEDSWDWDACEKKRLEGLKFAEMFAGLDALHDDFDGGVDGVLGSYVDLLW
ncbi:MAG: hypothetical protein Q9165_000007 [Trypethelium subeluteriae]